MNIFLVLHGFPPELTGGTERTVEALAAAMLAAGHQVTVISGTLEVGSPDRVVETLHHGIRVLRIHRDDLDFESWFKCYHPGVSRTLRRIFLTERPDVVHIHHWLRLTSDIGRLARQAGARVVITAHDFFTALAKPTRRAGETEVLAPAAVEWMSDLEAQEHFEMHRRDFYAEPQPGGKRLVTWGSLYAEKGLEVLLAALRAAGGGWHLTVLGQAHEPAYREQLEAAAVGLAVDFRGAYTEAELAAIHADYAVLPSICDESYGLVVDEAHALGLPILASDLPAYREHSQAAACHFVPPGDVAAWTELLTQGGEVLAGLKRPDPPELTTPVAAAMQFLGLYEAVVQGDWEPDPVLELDRTRLLFRRAERRLFSVKAVGGVVLPPDEFLGG